METYVSKYTGKQIDEAVDLISTGLPKPDLSQDDRNAADYVKGRTNYYTPYTGLGYRSFEVHPAELDFGVYLVGTADNASHFARIFDYETIISEKYGVMHCTMDIDWSSLGRGVIHLEPNPDNFLAYVQLIDDKNYKYDLNTAYGLTVYFIVDVETLADEYKDMFPTYGVYLHYYEGSYSFPIRNLNVVLMRYQSLDVRFMDSRVPTARTAKVGQTLVVKSVTSDEGRPIEWEAVDLPEGGGYDAILAVESTGGIRQIPHDGSTFSIVGGSLGVVVNKMAAGKPVSVALILTDGDGYKTSTVLNHGIYVDGLVSISGFMGSSYDGDIRYCSILLEDDAILKFGYSDDSIGSSMIFE
jgi:hypothetical protein